MSEEIIKDTAETEGGRSYAAFISYRHKPLDKEAAEKIQKKIESYVVPKELREKAGGKKLGLCFRDEDELPAASSLTDSIYYALDHSRFLIVICTPDLPLSKWCEQEIRYFLKTHDRDHVLAVLTDGDPMESFSPYLLHTYDEDGNITGDTEPLAANIAGPNHTIDNKALKKEVVRLYAALIGCPFDELWQRERRAKTNRLLSLAGLAMAVMAVFLGVVLNRNARIREQNEQIMEQNGQIMEQNDRISAQNEQIEEQNTELQKQLSSVLVDSGLTKLADYDVRGALNDALAAVENDDPEIYDHRVIHLLADALGAYKYNETKAEVVYEQSSDIMQLRMTDDDTKIIIKDRAGLIRSLDAETYEMQWEIRTGAPEAYVYTAGLEDRLIYKAASGVYCHSLADGTLRWSYEYDKYRENSFRAISADGSLFAVLDNSYSSLEPEKNETWIVILNTADGSEAGRAQLAKEGYTCSVTEYTDYYHMSGAFSRDNSLFACSLPVKSVPDNESFSWYFVIDLASFSAESYGGLIQHWYEYGLDIDPEDRSLFCAGHVSALGGVHTGLFTKNGDTIEFSGKSVTHEFGAPGGFNHQLNQLEDNDTTFLSRNGRVYVFSDTMFFTFSRSQNRLLRGYNLSGDVVNARWMDEEQGILELASSDGYVFDYYMKSYDEDGWMFSESRGDTVGTDIRCAVSVGGSMYYGSGYHLMVPKKNPGQLLRMVFESDVNADVFSPEAEDFSFVSEVAVDTGSDTAFYIYNGESVVTFDKKTGEIRQRAEFDDYVGSTEIYPLDDSSFVYQDMLYHMDGTSEEYGEPVNLRTYVPSHPYHHKRLGNGSLLSWKTEDLYYLDREYENDLGEGENSELLIVWLDGKAVPASTDVQTGILLLSPEGFENEPPIIAGSDNLIMAYGQLVDVEESRLSVRPEKQLAFMDAASGKVTVIDDACPDAGDMLAAFAHKSRTMAAAYDDGSVCFYNISGGTADVRDLGYSPNEISSVAFDSEDRYFLVLTSTGRLDLYNADDMSPAFSVAPKVLTAWSIDQTGSSYTLDSLEAVYTSDGAYMFVTAGNVTYTFGIMIDIPGQTTALETENLIAYDGVTNRVFCLARGGKVLSYPVYGLQTLTEWARGRLAK